MRTLSGARPPAIDAVGRVLESASDEFGADETVRAETGADESGADATVAAEMGADATVAAASTAAITTATESSLAAGSTGNAGRLVSPVSRAATASPSSGPGRWGCGDYRGSRGSGPIGARGQRVVADAFDQRLALGAQDVL